MLNGAFYECAKTTSSSVGRGTKGNDGWELTLQDHKQCQGSCDFLWSPPICPRLLLREGLSACSCDFHQLS